MKTLLLLLPLWASTAMAGQWTLMELGYNELNRPNPPPWGTSIFQADFKTPIPATYLAVTKRGSCRIALNALDYRTKGNAGYYRATWDGATGTYLVANNVPIDSIRAQINASYVNYDCVVEISAEIPALPTDAASWVSMANFDISAAWRTPVNVGPYGTGKFAESLKVVLPASCGARAGLISALAKVNGAYTKLDASAFFINRSATQSEYLVILPTAGAVEELSLKLNPGGVDCKGEILYTTF